MFHRLIASIILTGGILISASLFLAMRTTERETGLVAASEAGHAIARTISEAFRQRSEALERMARRWQAADGTLEELWRADAQAYHKSSPGELALGHANSEGTIVWIEPTLENQSAIGYNLRSEPTRRAIFERVKSSKKGSVVPAIKLAQGGYGFLFMFPVYRRNGDFDGVITSAYRSQEAIRALVDLDAYQRLKFDLSVGDSILSSNGQDGLTYLDDRYAEVAVTFLDQRWVLRVTPSEEFLNLHRSHIPFTVALVAFVYSVLLALLTEQWRQGHQREKIFKHISRELQLRQDIIDRVAMVAETDSQGRITYVNDLMTRRSGFSRDELIGNTHKVMHSGIHSPEFFRQMWQTIMSGDVWRGEVQNISRDGDPQWYDTTIVPTVEPNGAISKFTAIRFDLTSIRLADLRLKAAISVMESGFALFDSDDRLVLYNEGFIEPDKAALYGNPTGKTFEEIIRAFGMDDLTAVDAVADREAWINWRLELHRNPPDHPIEIQWTDGRWMRITERRTADGGCVGIWTDITEQKQREVQVRYEHIQLEEHAQRLTELAEEIEISRQDAVDARLQSEFLANHDALTALPNRRSFHEQLKGADASTDCGHAILFIDLDNFKAVNDTLGHDAGDDLLRLVAEKLRGSVREEDFIARLGGDEFAVLMSAPENSLREKAVALGNRIWSNLQIPVSAPSGAIPVGCTIGVSISPGDANSLIELVTLADKLMYVGKKQGKNRIVTIDEIRPTDVA